MLKGVQGSSSEVEAAMEEIQVLNTKTDKILIAKQTKEKNHALKLFLKNDAKLSEHDRKIVAKTMTNI